ncbi:MAG: methylated-DNA--[protein]-cysteine S-methyltransferase [bacterium]|nr:methylated-DNA--[protein]-cysteine S-methyltransferase [bacterium]MDT8396074.1 methylated-DNA--[protein]-cysteine S-methyltransferase [bacterium]
MPMETLDTRWEMSMVPSDYEKMEKAIRFLEDNSGDQPALDETARHVNLSPFHFQKVFKKWVGVSPKRYLQFLTVENAKILLNRSASVMDTAFDVGLSGPGRLHDLFVAVEAITPGQYKAGGAGVDIQYGFHETPFGLALLAMTRSGVTDLRFVGENGGKKALEDLRKRWPAASIAEGKGATGETVVRIFAGGWTRGSGIGLFLRGTNFQIKVWQALLRIPDGAVVSYAAVARAAGRPDAVRAAASAVGKNPVAWLIPCHRVLRSSGELGGYGGGLTRKKIMLAREIAAADVK